MADNVAPFRPKRAGGAGSVPPKSSLARRTRAQRKAGTRGETNIFKIFSGAAERNRTSDPVLTKDVLYP